MTKRPRGCVSALALLCVLGAGCRSEETFRSVGEVIGINPVEGTITLRHEAIADLLRPATSVFQMADDASPGAAVMGDRVRFELRRSDGKALQVTELEPITRERRGMHDHTPHHGGVVVMNGMNHFEAVAHPDGELQLYLTDRWRRPIAPETANGTVEVGTGAKRVTLPLQPRDGALEARVDPFGGQEVQAAFRIERAGEKFEMSFLLPVSRGGRGAVGIPLSGCAATPEGAPPELRCVMSFPRPITAIAARQDGDDVFVAAVDLGVTAWNLNTGDFIRGFEAPPAMRGPADEPPHVEAINALALQSGGDTLAVALENRALLYDTRNGRFHSGFTAPGVLRDLRWTVDDEALLIASFYTSEARLVDARDGLVRQRLSLPAETSALAVSPEGTRLAVGTSKGQIVVFDAGDGSRIANMDIADRTIRDLLFTREGKLVAAADDGTVRVVDETSPDASRRIEAGTIVYRLVASPEGEEFASSGMDGMIRFHRADGTVLAKIDWHHRQVFALAWPRPDLLISGDTDGRVVFWKVAGEAAAGD